MGGIFRFPVTRSSFPTPPLTEYMFLNSHLSLAFTLTDEVTAFLLRTKQPLGLGSADAAVKPGLLTQRQRWIDALSLGVERAAAQIQVEIGWPSWRSRGGS